MKQYGFLSKYLQSHLFTEDERNTILDTMGFYTVDEAKVNIDWAMEQQPIRKEQERLAACLELHQVVTQNARHLGEEQTRLMYGHCNNPKITTRQYREWKEEIKQLMET